MTLDNDQLKKLVAQEIELLLQRCVEAGASHEKAFGELNFQTTLRGMEMASAESRAKEAPYEALLQRAYDCQMVGDGPGQRQACLDWLKAKHGVQLGDTVLVDGWSVPREILLDDFIIQWRRDESLSCGFMWFTGPTSHVAKGKNPDQMGQSMDYSITKIEPSRKLKSMFPHRF